MACLPVEESCVGRTSLKNITKIKTTKSDERGDYLVASVAIMIPHLPVLPHHSPLLGGQATLGGDHHTRATLNLDLEEDYAGNQHQHDPDLVGVALYGEGVVPGGVVTVVSSIYPSRASTACSLCCQVETILQ